MMSTSEMLEIARKAMNSYLDYRLNPQNEKRLARKQKTYLNPESDTNVVRKNPKTPLIQ